MILAMLFAIPRYIHHDYQSSTEPHDQNVEEMAFLDDVTITRGPKINTVNCKEPIPFPAENPNLGAQHPWHAPLSMLFIYVAITIASMIAIATILKCLTRSNEELDGDRESSAGVSVSPMEEQCKEPKSEMVI